VVALLATVSTSAAPEPHRNFVTCPIVRDTSTVPCWLAEYKGELYFLTLQTDVSAPVNPPQLGHQVLVEGVVSNEPRICGGIVLKPVVLSVLPELDNSCSTVLPAEERYNLTFEPPRPPGPSKGRLAFAATRRRRGPRPPPRPVRDVRDAVRLRHLDPLPPRGPVAADSGIRAEEQGHAHRDHRVSRGVAPVQ
jgi:hypothetical protein